ncbi:HlyD family secretion protein [Legionella saoudiensis]|uniref:HlyD family secretion protein n=1 Tax=Legionella saoudiensis TaxID=1750561 RepID=UPI000730ABFC|nr:HlyD family efflux transporter periplasmic adaptor subunit [Legionella saoudiensis]
MNWLAKIKKLIGFAGCAILIVLLFLLNSCKNASQTQLTGYVEGRYIYITALISGTLKSYHITKGIMVNKGQLLFTLERETSAQNLTIAQANVQEARDELSNANSIYKMQKIKKDRDLILLGKDIISKETFEDSLLNYQKALQNKKIAQSKLASLQAQEQKAQWDSNQQEVKAPQTALVFDTFYTEGEEVAAGSTVVSLLDPSQIKIIFFIPQASLGKIKLDQLINVSHDMEAQPAKAKITYISPKAEYNPPVIYSNEERERLVFRVEAILEPVSQTLTIHPGQPITVIL